MIIAHIRSSFVEAFFPRLAEWFAAGVLLLIGIVLMLNDGMMAASTGRGYQLLLAIADQPTWATTMVLFAVCRLTILLINGAWRRSPHLRALSAFLSCFFWTQITLSFAPVFGFAFAMAAGWLALDMTNVMRAMRDARTVDDAYARGKHDRPIGN